MDEKKNYAFIDGANLYLGVRDLGWNLGYKKFRVYLKEKYKIQKAYLFIGLVANNNPLYKSLQEAGFILIFKPTILDDNNNVKGNCDADLVLQAMIDYDEYDQAVIVSGDGDFYSLTHHFYNKSKLLRVIAPNRKQCSVLLRKEAKGLIIFLDNLREKLEYKRKSTA
jgi:uncharacterized LabA/DUF88 family protein